LHGRNRPGERPAGGRGQRVGPHLQTYPGVVGVFQGWLGVRRLGRWIPGQSAPSGNLAGLLVHRSRKEKKLDPVGPQNDFFRLRINPSATTQAIPARSVPHGPVWPAHTREGSTAQRGGPRLAADSEAVLGHLLLDSFEGRSWLIFLVAGLLLTILPRDRASWGPNFEDPPPPRVVPFAVQARGPLTEVFSAPGAGQGPRPGKTGRRWAMLPGPRGLVLPFSASGGAKLATVLCHLLLTMGQASPAPSKNGCWTPARGMRGQRPIGSALDPGRRSAGKRVLPSTWP